MDAVFVTLFVIGLIGYTWMLINKKKTKKQPKVEAPVNPHIKKYLDVEIDLSKLVDIGPIVVESFTVTYNDGTMKTINGLVNDIRYAKNQLVRDWLLYKRQQ